MLALLAVLACDEEPDPGLVPTPDVPEETCNGLDDDGDLVVDEGVMTTWYTDADGDGVGSAPVEACVWEPGLVTEGGDCDDADPAITPARLEACGTPDDNCDGVVDEDGAEGCVPAWRVDEDADGYGDGEPACVCDPTGLIAEPDCDATDGDRGPDCTEGAEVALQGAHVLEDDAEEAWALVGAADVDAAAGPELVLATDGTLAVAALPAEGEADGEVLLSASLYGTRTLTPGSERAFGDLYGDGVTDLVEATYAYVGDAAEPEFFTMIPMVRAFRSPLTGDTVADWGHTLSSIHTSYASESVFVDDLDADGVPEVWYASGTAAGYAGEAAVWRANAADAVEVARTTAAGAFYRVLSAGDPDGDGFPDLATLTAGGAGDAVTIHPGPIGEALPESSAVVTTPQLFDVVALGDLDGDGYDDLALRGQRVHLLLGPVVSGDIDDLARARVGSETDDLDESALFATAGDVGGDGTRDLVVSDTYWPGRFGAEALRGAIYVFHTPPSGVVDVRAAETRVYGAEYGAFGAYPSVLDDGRVLVGAHLETHASGTGVFWLVEGL